ncbi:hypothetical protein CAPTEDRAFT_49213, partial [Capitella teleta]
TPLHVAITLNKRSFVSRLLESGASVEITDRFGLTPLHQAAINGDIFIIRKLIENGADPHARDNLYQTPAVLALINEQPDKVVSLLL